MAKLGNLYISLIADTATFSSGLAKAKSDLNSSAAAMNVVLATVDKQFHGVGESVKGFASEIFSLKGAFAALVGTIGVGSIVEMGKQAVESVGGLEDLAKQLGVTTDTLQTFSYAATQVGLSQEELQTGLAKLTKTIGEASTGNKTAIDSFDKFGIKILDAQGNVRATEAVIRDIANAMENMSDPAQRAAIATELMGKAGQKLIPFLEQGAAGLDDMVAKAKALGLVFDEETIRSADEAANKLKTLSYVLSTELDGALVHLAPDITLIAQKLIDFAGAVDRGANRVAAFFGVINTHNLGAVNEQITDLYQKLNDAESHLGSPWYNQNTLKQQIDDYKNQLADLVKIRSQLMSEQYAIDHPDMATTPGAGAGVSNPAPKKASTSTSGSRQSTTQAIKDQKNAVDDLIASMGQELALMKESDQQRAIDEAVIRAQSAAQRDYDAGLRDSPILTQNEVDRVKAMAASTFDLAQAQQQSAKSAGNQTSSFKEAKTATAGWSNAMTELGSTFTSAFEDAVISGKKLSDVLDGLMQDLERIALRIAENQVLQGLFGEGGIGSGGGLFGSIWDSLFGSSSSGVGSVNAATGMLGHAAAGGYIQVGENGPEKFWPGVSGLITPNSMDAGGGMTVIVNDYGGNQVSAQQQTNGDGTKQLILTIEQKLASSVRSGGPLRRAIGDTFGANGVAQVQRG